MEKVNVLPPEIVSKIAAGEVIERPASVVKELIENSFDAGTKSIEVHLKQAGKALINISDSGRGIAEGDIEKIFLRHSTSKIHSIEDLYNIGSLGFRGEALYSIAAISDILLRSKTENQDTGWEIHLRGGEKIDLKPVNMPVGTEIEIKEIFYNTPARRKFMKSDSAELSQILNIVIPYTMLYPEQKFLLSHSGRILLDLNPEKKSIQRIARTLRLKEENIIETYKNSADDNISIRLFLGDINIQRARRDMQFIFINKRPVQDRNLNFHLNQVYKLIFPQDIYPFFAVFIEMPPENVDVNMHPTKREVKIKDDRALIRLIRPLCEHALMALGQAKKIAIPPSPRFAKKTSTDKEKFQEKQKTFYIPPSEISEGKTEITPRTDRPKQYVLFTGPEVTTQDSRETLRNTLFHARYIGVFLKKYLFFESGTSLLLMDQHAAQERITYEKLLSQLESKKVEVQRLLTPLVMRLSTQEMLAWEEAKGRLEDIGISTTQWDNESIAVHSHPQLITAPEISVRNILIGEKVSRSDNDTLARWACRSSVMAGDEVKQEGALFLRDRLLECKDPFICPHGRPTVVEIEEKFLNKQFLRG